MPQHIASVFDGDVQKRFFIYVQIDDNKHELAVAIQTACLGPARN